MRNPQCFSLFTNVQVEMVFWDEAGKRQTDSVLQQYQNWG